ncbi:SUMO deconjugating cysteine peptidase Ulp2 [Schizosaccharomyces cryophilus OY26]|uniref:SUMO deconjugating cysteine peptidase Ulp2 n=1 Tax=Schizosaccharomyces cryophilus (strain OY26 / ATCC MYA-4695 / CBS 11777 / NBRC 106824 / NRRL Y48691) TaxID=653667 RepID=S9W6I9_SCHCR|nr:SUMO deconjugating cysteine peptidase Ulp2 [Schizosaccharomyces cryophilus OY26]EPY53440.1 SUMO deconjugating cysteine peptidase Ulp2 [Schizosaccharomyces cryophilus OY26]
MENSKGSLHSSSGSYNNLLPPFGHQSKGDNPTDAIPIKSPLERLSTSTEPSSQQGLTRTPKKALSRAPESSSVAAVVSPRQTKRLFSEVSVQSPRKKKPLQSVDLPFTKGGYGGFYDSRNGSLKFTKHELSVTYADRFHAPPIHFPVHLIKRLYWLQGWRDAHVESPVHAIHITLKSRDMKRIVRGDSTSMLFLYNPNHVEAARAGLDLFDQSEFTLLSPSSAKEFQNLLTVKQPAPTSSTTSSPSVSRVKNDPSKSVQSSPSSSQSRSATPHSLNNQASTPIASPKTPKSAKVPTVSIESLKSTPSRPPLNSTPKSATSALKRIPSLPSVFGDNHGPFYNEITASQESEKSLISEIPCQTLLIYPFTGTNTIAVNNTDLVRLNDGEFLNDTIVDFYLRYLYCKLEKESPSLAQSTHIFNSFFFSRLVSKDKDGKRLGQRGVRKWTQKFDLFTKKYVIVPINEMFHWYLAIICNIDQLIPANHKSSSEEEDEITLPSVQKDITENKVVLTSNSPVILIFDSLANMHKGSLKYLRDYLIDEAWERKKIQLKPTDIRGFHAKVPQQSNFSDCGIFALHFVELFLEAPQQVLSDILDKSARQNVSQSFDERWNVHKINTRREDIRSLIGDLSKEWMSNRDNQVSSERSKDNNDDDDDDLTVL